VAEGWLGRHAPEVASFLAGIILGSVLRVL
jgi:hypothetical protein